MEDNRNKSPQNPGENESNAAKRIRMLGEEVGEDTPVDEKEINKWENFWYHHKWKVIIIGFFSFMIITATAQFIGQQNPDVNLMYSGPDYITPNQNQAFCSVLEQLMPDYNGDGELYAQLNDLVYLTAGQLAVKEAEALEYGDTYSIDRTANRQAEERFTYEIFGAESPLCILAQDQYDMVKGEGGFMPLKELYEDGEYTDPDGAIDDYGVRLKETKLGKFYDSVKIFPDDAVLCLRRVPTMSAITGREKAEIKHEYHKDIFRRILAFEYPEGYVEPAETDADA
ncbi:MAG: hypothetical protein IJ497_10610 [Clostridia bacterium]|nr:hypothetical protein [Clostridia bacterium]